MPHGGVIVFALAYVHPAVRPSLNPLISIILQLLSDSVRLFVTTRYSATIVCQLVSQDVNTFRRPYSFSRIQQASKVPEECVQMNISLVRQGTFDVNDLDNLVQLPVRRF